MSLRNRNRSAIKTGYTHNVFFTPKSGLTSENCTIHTPINQSHIFIDQKNPKEGDAPQPEIVYKSINTDRILSQRAQKLNGKNVSFDDSHYKAQARLINSQSFQNRRTQRDTTFNESSPQQNETMGTIDEFISGPEFTSGEETLNMKKQLTGCQFSTLEFLFCKFLIILIQNDEQLLKAKNDFLEVKFNVEKRMNLVNSFSPVSMFQRIDRAGKGHITRQEILKFLQENGFQEGQGFREKDITLIIKKKINYQKFVKLLIDTKQDNSNSLYFNQRAPQCDQIIRKIDRLPSVIEQNLCKLLLLQINLKKEANFYRNQIKKQNDFNLIVLFKELTFEDQQSASKRIYPCDILRFFRINGLLIEETKVQDHLFDRIIGLNRVFDYKMLHKLLTSEVRDSIVFNPAVQVNGLSENHRRTLAHKETFNSKMLSSLTAPTASFIQQESKRQKCHRKVAGGPQPLRDRRHSQTSNSALTCDSTCRLGKAAHTKCFKTNHITEQRMVSSFQDFLRDQLLLDEELESAKIKLANERDFYCRLCFEKYLVLEKELPRATAISIYNFIYDFPCEEVGSVALADVEEFISEFTNKKYAVPGRQTSDEINQVRKPLQIQYHDFLDLITPMNKDFAELMLQRQKDLDIQDQETKYIIQGVLSTHKKGEIPSQDFNDTMCRVARPHFNFTHGGQLSHVPALLSRTILSLILNYQRNKEIRRTYEKATKGQHMGSQILRFLPGQNTNSEVVSVAQLLHFVSLDKTEAFGQGHCHGLDFENCGQSALSLSKRLVSRSKSREKSPLKLFTQNNSIQNPHLSPAMLSATLSERRKRTMSESTQLKRITRCLRLNEISTVEKQCEREVKFLAQRFGAAMEEKGNHRGQQFLAKRLIDEEITKC